MKSNFDQVVGELEALDMRFKVEGISDEYREKWKVNVNVGLWIVGRETAEWLHDQIVERRPQRIIELGTSVGYSTLWLAKAAQVYGGEIITLDRESFKTAEARDNLERVGLANSVTLVTAEMLDYLTTWPHGKIDFLFIDAGKREYLDYLKMLEPYLNSGAMVVADNVDGFGDKMVAYRDYVESHYQTQYVKRGDGLLVSIVD